MKKILVILLSALISLPAFAQESLKKVYDESIDPMEQIDNALQKAGAEC